MPKELKKYELSVHPRSMSTGRYALLANTVAVTVGFQRFYAYVSFSDALVDAVGRRLGGLHESDPAHLHVDIHPKDSYDVWAIKPTRNPELLWAGVGALPWLKTYPVKVAKNGHQEKKFGGSERTPRTDAASRYD